MPPCKPPFKQLNLKGKTMYYIFMTTASVVFLLFGAFNVDGGYLWVSMLVMGGVFFGHVLTEALNEK
jgi:membrane protein DedA with SNARE-associated domain